MTKTTAIGRRKEASARVRVSASSGKGSITVNGKDYKDFFPQKIFQQIIEQPLNLLDAANQYQIIVNVIGGGVKGQAEAVRLGISRLLVKENEENKSKLRAADLLTRDPRAVERKKSGRKKARKRFQFSKR